MYIYANKLPSSFVDPGPRLKEFSRLRVGSSEFHVFYICTNIHIKERVSREVS